MIRYLNLPVTAGTEAASDIDVTRAGWTASMYATRIMSLMLLYQWRNRALRAPVHG